MINRAWWIRGTIGLFFAAILLGYAGYETRGLVGGLHLVIEEPQDGALVTSPVVRFRGSAENASLLYLNGRQIFTNPTGVFDESLLVPEGYTILELRATDRFKRTVVRHVRIVYHQKETETP